MEQFGITTWGSGLSKGQLFDVAVVIPSLLRPTLPRALRSVFAQDFQGSVQILIGIDAPATPDILAAMWQSTDFDALRSREKDKDGEKAGFFRSGRTDSWRDEAPPEAIAELERSAEIPMKRLGYAVTA